MYGGSAGAGTVGLLSMAVVVVEWLEEDGSSSICPICLSFLLGLEVEVEVGERVR